MSPPRWLTITALVAAVATHHGVREGCWRDRGAATDGTVVTWNLRNFTAADHDVAAMAATLAEVDAPIVAVEEVLDAEALATMLPGRRVLLSQHGGARDQRLGLAIADHVELLEGPREHRELELGGRVRPAVEFLLREGDTRLRVVVVHLKATPRGLPQRRLQWAALAQVIARAAASGDHDAIVVIGDFNVTGDDDLSADDERAALSSVLARVGLRAVVPAAGCSAYWDGRRRDAWLEPSLLDLAFVGGAVAAAPSLEPLGACARHGCAPLRSTDAYPDRDLAGTSDHCPMLLRWRPP
ncbi:MAG: endonuclease/exonuclease/phosphatase family protein [Deltaproteobacteria bacterium]|nr:endonuclease/exonuclease/phosphatase family protein [Deltaproteobacteria bacterium]MBK8716867.1 endonuclease/exonuclease/phosphatase family protein [Deltaproteobacteria bacterium]MBP7286973.1 endonuclease/exonuclease/phosphatase family protein [Nannocystaceae bacterium]